MRHPVVPSLIFALLVLTFLVKLVLHFDVQVMKLLVVTNLIGLQRVVDFLTLIDRVLLDVLDLSDSRSEKNERYAHAKTEQRQQKGTASEN